MGWTSCNAIHYKKDGSVDRKAEIESMINGTILKSAVVGSVYYAAVRDDKNGDVSALVFLTSVDSRDYYNFAYKPMHESMGPIESKCPASILALLTPTEDEYANDWRNRCKCYNEKKKALEKVPVGGSVFINLDGERLKIFKCAPAYQFKTAWWYCPAHNTYINKKIMMEAVE